MNDQPTVSSDRVALWLKIGQVVAPLIFAVALVWIHTQNELIHQTPEEKIELIRTEIEIILTPIVRDLTMVKLKIDAGVLPIAEVKIEALYDKLGEMEARLMREIQENRKMIREGSE